MWRLTAERELMSMLSTSLADQVTCTDGTSLTLQRLQGMGQVWVKPQPDGPQVSSEGHTGTFSRPSS